MQPGIVAHCTGEGEAQITISAASCNYGGLRFWFVCPGCEGNRLVLRYLESKNSYFCNNCLNAVHASTQMGKSDRVNKATWKRLNKYNLTDFYVYGRVSRRPARKKRLNKYNLTDFYSGLDTVGMWAKPKGMHRRTWSRIVEKHNDTLLKDPMFRKYMVMVNNEAEEIRRYKAGK